MKFVDILVSCVIPGLLSGIIVDKYRDPIAKYMNKAIDWLFGKKHKNKP